MTKRIDMTRERKIALPIILEAARAARVHVPMTGQQRRNLEKALEAFK